MWMHTAKSKLIIGWFVCRIVESIELNSLDLAVVSVMMKTYFVSPSVFEWENS